MWCWPHAWPLIRTTHKVPLTAGIVPSSCRDVILVAKGFYQRVCPTLPITTHTQQSVGVTLWSRCACIAVQMDWSPKETCHCHWLPVLLHWCWATKINWHQFDPQWTSCVPESVPMSAKTLPVRLHVHHSVKIIKNLCRLTEHSVWAQCCIVCWHLFHINYCYLQTVAMADWL